jgi:hypothetical protein
MKLLQAAFQGLLAILAVVPVSGLAQGTRMSPDFLPLGVGNTWVYSVATEDGNSVGEVSFSVRELTIIGGQSFYVLSGFPFVRGEAIRLVRYDKDDHQYVKASWPAADVESPLFSDDGATDLLQEDSFGIVQKFNWTFGDTVLTFERGVGVVAARYETEKGIRIARIISSRFGEANRVPGPVSSGPAAPVVVTRPPEPVKPSSPKNVTPVTGENPALIVTAAQSDSGIKFTLTVLNTVDKLLPFQFSSGQNYDFVITDPATGQEVWRWSGGMFFTQVVRSEAIRASGNWKYEAVWDRRDRNSSPVAPGRYRLTGVLTSIPPVESRPIYFEVQ